MRKPTDVQTTVLAVPANDRSPVFQSLAVAEFDGEPRVRDLDLAEMLGFERPRKIRELIERNRPEIDQFGTCPTVGRVVRGNQTQEFYLNEEQALVIATLSNTSQARAVRTVLIRTFVAYRRGQLEQPATLTDTESRKVMGGIMKAVVHKEISEAIPGLVDRLVEQRLEADPRVAVLNYRLPIHVLEEHRVPSKGRRSFSRKIGGRLLNFSIDRGLPVRKSPETGRRMFHVEAISGWLEAEGRAMIRDHADKVAGQTVMKLVKR